MRTIPFSPPDISELEIGEVCEALRSGWITTGPRVRQFEKNLSEYIGTKKVVCLSSATAAEELNLRALGIKEGDEVIVPAYTYTATASAPIHCGAKLRIVDIQPSRPEFSLEALEKAITPKTKAIIAVDIGGIICDYEPIFKLVEAKKSLFKPESELQEVLGRIAVFADCAHALGATKGGKKAGQIADFTSFSFHAVKNLTTAEGGAATWREIDGVDNEKLYKLFQLYSLHGQSKDAFSKNQAGAWEYDIIGPWYKCNMTDVTAAIGLKQLERYPSLLKRRREIIERYDEACDRLGVLHLDHYGKDHSGSGHLYITRVPGIDEEKRNAIIAGLAELGVSANVHYKPLPMMTAYRNLGFKIKDFPNAFDFFRNEITLPLHTKLSDEDVEYVIEAFEKTLKNT